MAPERLEGSSWPLGHPAGHGTNSRPIFSIPLHSIPLLSLLFSLPSRWVTYRGWIARGGSARLRTQGGKVRSSLRVLKKGMMALAATRMPRSSNPGARVYVGNLAYSVRWTHLKDHMRAAGNVVFAEVLLQPGGRSKGCGVVEYSNLEEAQRAVAELTNTNLLGRPIFVREDREAHRPLGAQVQGAFQPMMVNPIPAGGFRQGPPTQIQVFGLPIGTRWQELKDMFGASSAGATVLRADVLPTGDESWQGVVLFNDTRSASEAVGLFNGFEYKGRRIEVRLHSAGAAPAEELVPPSSQIFVNNLPWTATNQQLVDFFSTVADVVQAEVLCYPEGRSKGAGVVELESPEEALRVIEALHLAEFNGRKLMLRYNRGTHQFGRGLGLM